MDVGFESDSQKLTGSGGGGVDAGDVSRGGALPELIDTIVPGAHRTEDWVREVQSEMRNPPVQFVLDFEVRDGSRSGRGGSARRRLAGASVLGNASAWVVAKLGQCACVAHGQAGTRPAWGSTAQ